MLGRRALYQRRHRLSPSDGTGTGRFICRHGFASGCDPYLLWKVEDLVSDPHIFSVAWDSVCISSRLPRDVHPSYFEVAIWQSNLSSE